MVVNWANPTQLAQAVTLIGQVLNQPARAGKYVRYLHDTTHHVHTDVGRVPDQDRPRVAYLQYTSLAAPGGSEAHYWLPVADGVDVASATDASGSPTYSAEQILAWNPQVIITQSSPTPALMRRAPASRLSPRSRTTRYS